VKIKVSRPRVSSPCGAWLPLTKIVLVGDNTPQNRSCGWWRTTKPFLWGSSTTTNTFLQREEGKHEMHMRCKWECKGRKCFSSFSYELGEKQEKREQRKEELGVGLMQLGRGECPWRRCTTSNRGKLPHARPTMVVGRPCGGTKTCPLFSELHYHCHMLQKWVNECRGKPVLA